jgi:hypothetical protein
MIVFQSAEVLGTSCLSSGWKRAANPRRYGFYVQYAEADGLVHEAVALLLLKERLNPSRIQQKEVRAVEVA